MTRLKENDIKDIGTQLSRYEDELRRKTNRTLLGLACHGLGVGEEQAATLLAGAQAAVVPVTGGQGVITGFSAVVAAILSHIGMDAYVTGHSDVGGMAEAFERKAHLLFMADDDRFAVFNIKTGIVIDNGAATGKGFAAGLDLMSGGTAGRRVLVIGCGPVGYAAVERLAGYGAKVSVYDIERAFSCRLAERIREQHHVEIKIEKDLGHALRSYRLIVDATNAGNIIPAEAITEQTYIAVPGMPCGLTPGALKAVSERLHHDPLQTGVAVMAVSSIAG